MNVLAELVALLAPPGCLACGRALALVSDRLCVDCSRALPWLHPGCPRCGLPVHRGKRCPAGNAAFSRAWAPLAYQGVARKLVAALKFRGALAVADLMAAQIAANLPSDLRRALDAGEGARTAGARELGREVGGRGLRREVGGRELSREAGVGALGRAAGGGETGCASSGAAVLVPVPAMPARRRRRGFDPARVLTAALAKRTERPMVDCLIRADRAHRQVGASRRERRAPGRLEIRVRGSPPPIAILVDDVHTTGATLDACARALSAGGSTVLAVVSYARTL